MLTSLLTSALLSCSPCAPAPVPIVPDDSSSGNLELMTNREMYSSDRLATTPPPPNRYERRHPIPTQKERRGIRRLALQTTVPYNLR